LTGSVSASFSAARRTACIRLIRASVSGLVEIRTATRCPSLGEFLIIRRAARRDVPAGTGRDQPAQQLGPVTLLGAADLAHRGVELPDVIGPQVD